MMREWREAQSWEERALLAMGYLCLAVAVLAVAVLAWDRGGALPAWPEVTP
jgi:hypothetical protein